MLDREFRLSGEQVQPVAPILAPCAAMQISQSHLRNRGRLNRELIGPAKREDTHKNDRIVGKGCARLTHGPAARFLEGAVDESGYW